MQVPTAGQRRGGKLGGAGPAAMLDTLRYEARPHRLLKLGAGRGLGAGTVLIEGQHA